MDSLLKPKKFEIKDDNSLIVHGFSSGPILKISPEIFGSSANFSKQ